ncbi:MAG: hypothetical protein FJW39_17725 [Acidobacteria bacterium]|nr:hypothetical protein [Acidobacteriota bacterium]
MRFTLLLLWAGLSYPADWTRYRGPNGSGVADAVNLPAEAGKDKNVVWKSPVLKGNSSPVIAKGRVFVTGHEGVNRLTLCYDAATGKELWRASIERTRDDGANPINGPATPTPATDGNNVYVFFPEFGLISYTAAGKERWRRPAGPFNVIQGVATSPVLADGNVILFIDQSEGSFIAAFDAKSGAQRWKTQRPDGFLGGYSTPVVRKPAKGPLEVVVAGAMEITAYQASTGEKLWWIPGVTLGPAASPLLSADTLYTLEPHGDAPPPFTSMLSADKNKDGKIGLDELGNNAVLRKLMAAIDKAHGNNDGVVEASEWNKSFAAEGMNGLQSIRLGHKGAAGKDSVKWRYTKGLPYVTSPLLLNNIVYVVRNGGILTAVDAGSGELLKTGRLTGATGEYYASPVAGDGKIYFLDKDGKLTIVRPGKDWEILASADLDEQAIATPAIAGNRIFVRTAGTLYCFGS